MDWLTCTSASGVRLSIACDIVTSYEHTSEVEFSDYAIENGTTITDHIVRKPKELTVQLTQSMTPLSAFENGSPKDLDVRSSVFEPSGLLWLVTGASKLASAAVGALFGSSSGGTKYWSYDRKPKKDFVNELHDALMTSQNAGHECEVVLKGKTYTGIRMRRIQRSYSAQAGDGAERFTVEFRELKILETATATLPKPASLAPRVDKGKLSKTDASALEKDAVKKSLLKKGVDKLVEKALQ